MNRFFLTLISMGLSQFGFGQDCQHLTDFNLNGTIKSIVEHTYLVKDSSDQIVPNKLSPEYEHRPFIQKFDTSGYLIERLGFDNSGEYIVSKNVNYHENGRLESELVFKTRFSRYDSLSLVYQKEYTYYDSNNVDSTLRIRYHLFGPNNQTFYTETTVEHFKYLSELLILKETKYKYDDEKYKAFYRKYEYDSNNVVSAIYGKSTISDSFDLIISFIYDDTLLLESNSYSNVHYKYDSIGLLIEKSELNNDSTIRSIERYSYHPNKVMASKKTYGKTGSLGEVITYDSLGNVQSQKYVLPDFSENIVTFEYSFDSNNNWIQRIEYYNGKAGYITRREIEYY